MLSRLLLLEILILLIVLPSPVCSEGLVVIVNNQNHSDSLSSDLVSDIYLGRTKRFPTGEPAKPLDLPKNLSITNDFYTKVVKKSPAQLRAHWSRLVFTGKGRPPQKLADELKVKSMVYGDNEMIGYVYEQTADEEVKIILNVP
jgi:ABC-type phosphate transport system substrate-binding protein